MICILLNNYKMKFDNLINQYFGRILPKKKCGKCGKCGKCEKCGECEKCGKGEYF